MKQHIFIKTIKMTTTHKRKFVYLFIFQVELGPGGNELLESTVQEDEERRALDKRKYLALSRRCKEIEQVCVSVCVSLRVCKYGVC